MNEKYSLKGSHTLLSVELIKKELYELGYQAKYLGTARSSDGEYESHIVIDHGAFNQVCIMLVNERAKTRETQCALLEQQHKCQFWKWFALLLCAACVALSALTYHFYGAVSALKEETISLENKLSSLNIENTSLNSKYKRLEAQQAYAKKEIDSYSTKLKTMEKERNSYKNKLYAIEDEYDFYHDHAVVVTVAGEKYHRYGCYHTNGSRFYIYNIENAIYKGYEACLDCIG